VLTVVVNVPENSVALFFTVENKMEEGGSSVYIPYISVKNIGYETWRQRKVTLLSLC
jgi:hypothetical protein